LVTSLSVKFDSFSFLLCAFAALRLCVNPLPENLATACYPVTWRCVIGRNLVALGTPPIGNVTPPSAPNSLPTFRIAKLLHPITSLQAGEATVLFRAIASPLLTAYCAASARAFSVAKPAAVTVASHFRAQRYHVKIGQNTAIYGLFG
jgi:hypothetical protein